ncbi:hypothetical protein N9Y60_05210, partial [Crocinitomicaceae bacterium]|nr:hypothetical protein [Crocinitomicaceae bacterium]
MAKSISYINQVLHEREKVETIEALSKNLNPLTEEEIASLDHEGYNTSADVNATQDRLNFLKNKDKGTEAISAFTTDIDSEKLKGNIENFVGMAQIPIGLAGPLYINGKDARGDFYIPLATTEGALIASYNRGMKACRLSGGITSVCLVEGVQRSPFFKFKNIGEVGMFIKWIHDNTENIKNVVSETSRFARLNEVNSNIEGNSVIVTFEFYTGDAAGQNMVTICTDRICRYIFKNFEIRPVEWYIESNYSGDKKATALSFSNVRGKKVAAEITLPKKIVAEVLKTTPRQI